MKLPNVLTRILALWLTLAIALPNPAFALRQAGLEENSAKPQMAERLRGISAAGSEEIPKPTVRDLKRWAKRLTPEHPLYGWIKKLPEAEVQPLLKTVARGYRKFGRHMQWTSERVVWGRSGARVMHKPDGAVTDIEKEVQDALNRLILQFDSMSGIGEEGSVAVPGARYTVLSDPVDGTANYIRDRADPLASRYTSTLSVLYTDSLGQMHPVLTMVVAPEYPQGGKENLWLVAGLGIDGVLVNGQPIRGPGQRPLSQTVAGYAVLGAKGKENYDAKTAPFNEAYRKALEQAGIKEIQVDPDNLPLYLIPSSIADPPLPGLHEELVDFINSRGEKIVTAVMKPSGTGPFPVAFMFHGLTGNKEEEHIRKLAERLTQAGYLTVRPDFRNNRKPGQDRTDPQFNQSDGELPSYSLDGMLEDAATVVEQLSTQVPEADLSRVVLAGHSYGGWTARHVAALKFRGDKRFSRLGVQAVADLSGIIHPRATLLRVLMGAQKADFEEARRLLDQWQKNGQFKPFDNQRYWLGGWERYAATADLSAIPRSVPYLYFVGDKDEGVLNQGVEAEYGSAAYQGVSVSKPVAHFLKALEGRGITPTLWPGLQHAYAGPKPLPAAASPDVLEQTIARILQTIPPAAGLEEEELGVGRAELGVKNERWGTASGRLNERGGDGAWIDIDPKRARVQPTPQGPVEKPPYPTDSFHSPSGNSQTLTQNITTRPTPAAHLIAQGMGLTNNPVMNVAGSNSLKMSIKDRATNSRFFSERNSPPIKNTIKQNISGINKSSAAGSPEQAARFKPAAAEMGINFFW